MTINELFYLNAGNFGLETYPERRKSAQIATIVSSTALPEKEQRHA